MLLLRIFPGIGEFFRDLRIPEFLDKLIARVKVPENSAGRFAFCFLSELISFFIIATNFRALAKGYIFWTVITDGLIVMQSTVISKVYIENEKTRDGMSALAFTLGGMGGSAISIVLTKYVWGS